MLIDEAGLRQNLRGFASDRWVDELLQACASKLGKGSHGDLDRWRQAVAALPVMDHRPLATDGISVDSDVVLTTEQRRRVYDSLQALAPWRKGPFRIGDVFVDSEWRSDRKWQRVEEVLGSLENQRILDVGSGNGYYALRMFLRGARLVIGVDPTLLFVAQFAAIRHFIAPVPVFVLPLRLQEVPQAAPLFDVVVSMGVLYHQRAPQDHLAQLRAYVRPGGKALLETLILPGDHSEIRNPEGRYARMRNVWHLPTRNALLEWLHDAGFTDLRVAGQSRTTTEEQRATDWMPYESLREALDPRDPLRTIEGLPAPLRIVVTGRRP